MGFGIEACKSNCVLLEHLDEVEQIEVLHSYSIKEQHLTSADVLKQCFEVV